MRPPRPEFQEPATPGSALATGGTPSDPTDTEQPPLPPPELTEVAAGGGRAGDRLPGPATGGQAGGATALPPAAPSRDGSDASGPEGDIGEPTSADGPGEPASPTGESSAGGAGQAIAIGAILIALGNVLSRILGVAREAVIAAVIGYQASSSAFSTAARVPTMVYDLLIGGAISAALIPVFSEWAEGRDREELWDLVRAVITAAIVVMGAAALLLVVGAKPLVWLMADGLPPEAQEEAAGLIRIVGFALIFFATAAVTTSALYALQVFVYPAFAAAGYNIGVIGGALLLGWGLGLGAAGVAAGIVAGAALQVILQWPGLHRRGFRYRPRFGHPELHRIVRYYLPVAAGLIVTQLSILLDTKLANYTAPTSAAVMRFATTLVQLPIGLVATGIAFAVLPALSRLAPALDPATQATAEEEAEALDRYQATLATGIKFALVAIVPLTVGLCVMAEPVIRLLLQRGAFDAVGTELTALAFLLYAAQIPFIPVDQLLINAFYARKDTMTPMVVGLASVGIYLAVALALIAPFGMPGLVLANTAQNVSHTVIMWVLVRRMLRQIGGAEHAGLGGQGIGSTALKVGAASTAMGLAVWLLSSALAPLSRSGTLGLLVEVVAAALVGAAVYLALVAALRVPELRLIVDVVRRRRQR